MDWIADAKKYFSSGYSVINEDRNNEDHGEHVLVKYESLAIFLLSESKIL